jgi:peptidyl-prolyl cis-trans isomerase C
MTCAAQLGFAIAIAAGAALVGQQMDPSVLATVDGRTITVGEFRELLAAQRKSGDQDKLVETLTESGRKRLLHDEVDRLLAARAARDEGLDKDASVQRAIARATDAVLAEALLERRVAHLDLSDDALRRYYAAHPDRFAVGPRVKARHIVVPTRADAENVLGELSAGADFSTIATHRNIDDTKARGGDLGWVKKGVMVKPFEDALFALKPGQISGIVQTRFGYHDADLAELRAALGQKYRVTVHEEALAQLGK